jgi:hypothetical protein
LAGEHELRRAVLVRRERDMGEGAYGVEPGLVAPGDAGGEARGEEDARLFFAAGGGEHQGRFEVVVAADHGGFVALIDEEFLGLEASVQRLCVRGYVHTAICVKP